MGGILQNLAAEAGNRESMWMDEKGAQAVLVEGAKLTDPADRESRERALGALRNLAARTAKGEGVPYWKDHEEARQALQAASKLSDPADSKSKAHAEAALLHLTVTSATAPKNSALDPTSPSHPPPQTPL